MMMISSMDKSTSIIVCEKVILGVKRPSAVPEIEVLVEYSERVIQLL